MHRKAKSKAIALGDKKRKVDAPIAIKDKERPLAIEDRPAKKIKEVPIAVAKTQQKKTKSAEASEEVEKHAKSFLKSIYSNVTKEMQKVTEDKKKPIKRDAKETFTITPKKLKTVKLDDTQLRKVFENTMKQISSLTAKRTGMNLDDIEGMERMTRRKVC